MSMQPGQVILNGKYRIEGLIGEGGMACVWLAEELTFGGRQVTLKEPRDNLLPELAEEMRLRYRREVQVCAALDKAKVPNIVRAFTADPYDDTVLLAMEYMPGGDLAALLREHPGGLPVEQALSIALDLLQALEGVHAHELEIVHRDIKPSNVLFDGEGRAHLADFGLAQLAGVSGRSQLRGGQHPGTPIYMAPEQETSTRTLTPAADIFALGCVLFEMLTGQRTKRHQPGTRVSALRPDLPPWLDEIVAKALEEDPWERWRDAGDMVAALEEGRTGEQTRQRERVERLASWYANAEKLASRQPEEALALVARIREEEADYPNLDLLERNARSTLAAQRRQQERARTEQAPASARVRAGTARAGARQEPTRRSWLIPVLLGAAAIVGLVLGGLWATGLLTRVTPTPEPTSTPTPEPTSTPTPEPQTRPQDGMEMVYVPAGAFEMGSDDGADNEQPVHTVTLDGYWIDRTEVTNAQYRAFVTATGHRAPTTCDWGESTYEEVDKADHPVVCVSGDDAAAYCEWAGGRLPTEAEWEKAARGTDGRMYPWGDVFDGRKLNYCDASCEFEHRNEEMDDGYARTAPVGSYAAEASPYGALDMAGNVWEWVSDVYEWDYYGRSPGENPQGPESGEYRVLRGGSWYNDLYFARSAVRYWYNPAYCNYDVGFRCVGLPEPMTTFTPTPTLTPALTLASTPTPTNTPVPSTSTLTVPAAGDTATRAKDGMVMAYVPAGEFTMGSTDAAVDDVLESCSEYRDDCESSWFEHEQPAHDVYLDAFWIDRTEVTNAQFAAFLNEQGNHVEGGVAWLEPADGDCLIEVAGGEYRPKSGYGEHPVIEVSWYGAAAYCAWVGGRLPTEAEWEKAARGTDGRMYPWGDAFDGGKLNYCDRNCGYDHRDDGVDDGYARTAPIGSYAAGASPYGGLDMVGNVWEWVADWYDGSYYGRSPVENPQGPDSGKYRVSRGGSWYNRQPYARSAYRYGYYPDSRDAHIGFRCVGLPTSSP